MKKGRIHKKRIILEGFSQGEMEALQMCLRERFPGRFIVTRKGDGFLLTSFPPEVKKEVGEFISAAYSGEFAF